MESEVSKISLTLSALKVLLVASAKSSNPANGRVVKRKNIFTFSER
jgi:hypothetical protein